MYVCMYDVDIVICIYNEMSCCIPLEKSLQCQNGWKAVKLIYKLYLKLLNIYISEKWANQNIIT